MTLCYICFALFILFKLVKKNSVKKICLIPVSTLSYPANHPTLYTRRSLTCSWHETHNNEPNVENRIRTNSIAIFQYFFAYSSTVATSLVAFFISAKIEKHFDKMTKFVKKVLFFLDLHILLSFNNFNFIPQTFCFLAVSPRAFYSL